jgi:hypothetical protein
MKTDERESNNNNVAEYLRRQREKEQQEPESVNERDSDALGDDNLANAPVTRTWPRKRP